MKKTLIALMALAGMAAAADLTLTTGITYNGELYNGYTNPNVEGLDYTHSDWPGSITGAPLTFSIDLNSLFGSSEIGNEDTITLNTLTVKVHPGGWAMDSTRFVSLSVVGNDAYTYSQAIVNNAEYVVRNGGELTLSNLNLEGLTKNDTLTFTIDGGSDHTVALAGSTAGTWSGVGTFDTSNWDNRGGGGYTNAGTNAAPLVSLNVTTAPIPEPTTATLSLLALAGLAARRRRRK